MVIAYNILIVYSKRNLKIHRKQKYNKYLENCILYSIAYGSIIRDTLVLDLLILS